MQIEISKKSSNIECGPLDTQAMTNLIAEKNKEIEKWKESCIKANYEIEKMKHQYKLNTFEAIHWRE